MEKKNWLKILLGLFAALAVLGIIFVLKDEKAIVVHPKGVIAEGLLDLIIAIISLMLVIIVPTYIALFYVVWKQRSKIANTPPSVQPSSAFNQLILWILPSIIVACMIGVTWGATHKLDPYNPIKSDAKPLTIQVIALDWKWLFIYPEQGIAAVNFFQFPVGIPVHFKLSADESPMNSFWMPQLSGQIYAMTGMITQLHVMANEPGEYSGKAAEINGEGYASMTFVAKASSESDFEKWIASVKQSPLHLTDSSYTELVKPSLKNPIALYSDVKKGLFDEVVMKYMYMPQPN
ncbi:MAG: COX aromatic rich motif-containing protein [Parachlamydiaceae bacterium]|nr:COX aromatic rich motif-containing protein [Parachlamydiaceae bacterium]